MKTIDNAMFSDHLPVNTYPFLKRMMEILDENDTNNPDDLSEEEKRKFKKNLWMVMVHSYNQLAKIDLMDEYKELQDVPPQS